MSRLRVFALSSSLLLLSAVPACAEDDGQVKKDLKELGHGLGKTGKDVGHAIGEAGKDVGQAGKEVGLEIGHAGKEVGLEVGHAGKEVGLEVAGAAKKVWYKGKEVSAPLLEDMRRATREFWKNVLERKDETIESLRRRNEDLKRRSEKPS